MTKKIRSFGTAGLIFLLVIVLSFNSKFIIEGLKTSHEYHLIIVFFITGLIFALNSLVSHVSRLTNIPSFVVAIFFGIAAKPFLGNILNNYEILSVIVGLGATLILFSGGLETPFVNFKRLLPKIISLSFIGLFFTAFATSMTIFYFGALFSFNISLVTSVLLGAVLASTDPAAIIPVLKKLKFNNRAVKDIIVSESAVTDVTGTLLTVVFLSFIANKIGPENIQNWYGSIFGATSEVILVKQLFYGILLGIIGYGFLEFLLYLKRKVNYGHEADLPFFLFVPIIIFVFAILFEGSGYLAAFIAGLLFHLTEHLKETEDFFNNLIDGFMKPTIFLLLGGLVNIAGLLKYSVVGISVALAFMFIIRPIAVFLSLILFKYLGREKLNSRDLLFISFVRETGAIPAVLLVTIVSLGLPQIDGLLEIGMWVILLTLIVEPPLTPFVAKFLKVATPIEDEANIQLSNSPSIMIVTRGFGFMQRLREVSDYASKYDIRKVIVLLCLESKYSEDLEKEIERQAKDKFKEENLRLFNDGRDEIEYEFISRKGLLEDNIQFISDIKDTPVVTIFAGKKILDYHLNEIKQLSIPIKFVD